jgi:hypothetical protein
MTELLQAAVLPPNLVATGLLVFVLLYWLTVIVGLLDFKTVDFHVGSHVELHAGGTHLPSGDSDWLNGALAFFNLGRIPLMVFLSFVALPLWAGSIPATPLCGQHLPGQVPDAALREAVYRPRKRP